MTRKSNFIRRMLVLLLSISLMSCTFGCEQEEIIHITQTEPSIHEAQEQFRAVVLEISESNVIVEPMDGEDELLSSNRISFNFSHLEVINPEPGSVVDIKYSGHIMETYPAQINAISWNYVGNLRDMKYSDQWVNKTDDLKIDNSIFTDIIITKIYSNCFFAHCLVPMPYSIKLNGSLSEEWCVGDQVAVTFENAYFDAENGHTEADLLTIKESTFQLQEGVYYKPVIYLYPEKKLNANVTLCVNGKLTCTYPKYENGWQVTAFPDGTLIDQNGQSYNYLYWEGDIYTRYDFSKGFCVKGSETAVFLEKALALLGLTRKEANEFIVYWLPLMEQNPYNIITFQTDAYTDSAKLQVSPAPDTLIRVFMAWQACEEFIPIEEQVLTAPERNGFTVVEWGGTEIK